MNLLKNKNFLRATAALVGTMVGVGIFGIPFAFSKAGFWTGFLFLILIAAITLLADLMYGEVVLRTRAKHQLVGYTQFYLGPFFKKALFFTAALSTYSALLAYIIISGDFMNNVFSWVFYVSPESYSIIFFVVLSLLILRGLKTVSWAELLLTALFFAVVLGIFFLSLDKLNFSNFKGGALEFWFLPYGILLFAFAGLPAVPLQREILGSGSERLFKKSIFAAVILAAALYFVFAFTEFCVGDFGGGAVFRLCFYGTGNFRGHYHAGCNFGAFWSAGRRHSLLGFGFRPSGRQYFVFDAWHRLYGNFSFGFQTLKNGFLVFDGFAAVCSFFGRNADIHRCCEFGRFGRHRAGRGDFGFSVHESEIKRRPRTGIQSASSQLAFVRFYRYVYCRFGVCHIY